MYRSLFIHWKRIRSPVWLAAVIITLIITAFPQRTWADEAGEKKLVITIVDETEYMQIDDEQVPLAVYNSNQGMIDPGSFVLPAGIGILIGSCLIYSFRQKRKRLLLRQNKARIDYELAQQYKMQMNKQK